MFALIVKRLLWAIPTIFILMTLTFFLVHQAPGSPLTDERVLPPEVMANIEAKYNLDKPLWQQYVIYLDNFFRGDLGPSFSYRDYTVNDLIKNSFPVSVTIGLSAFIFSVTFGILLGVISALKQNSWLDYIIMAFTVGGVALPSFVIAPVLVLIFAIYWSWLPAGGWNGGAWPHLILPVLAMSSYFIASIARIMRSSLIEVLHSPYLRTAKAKGLPFGYIIRVHALKPAILPVVSYLGPAFVGVITGSVVIETIFGLPGMGQLFVNGALNRDYSLVLALTILLGILTIIMTTVLDLIYAWIDPRIRVKS